MGESSNSDDRRSFRSDDDPTKMANQPALRTSSGAVWLIVGALLTAVCLAVLIPLMGTSNPAPLVGAVLIVLLYIAMVVARFAVSARVARLRVMAALFGGIALVGLLAVLISAYANTP